MRVVRFVSRLVLKTIYRVTLEILLVAVVVRPANKRCSLLVSAGPPSVRQSVGEHTDDSYMVPLNPLMTV
jgi:hypothetical protein